MSWLVMAPSLLFGSLVGVSQLAKWRTRPVAAASRGDDFVDSGAQPTAAIAKGGASSPIPPLALPPR